LQADIEVALGRPVRLANDANCFALSEATDGAGACAETVFGVILGTGVGGGIALGRQILPGANAIAGEWGQIPYPGRNRTKSLDRLAIAACRVVLKPFSPDRRWPRIIIAIRVKA
jgi:predicted NBD/HSP70 family sugar kinase